MKEVRIGIVGMGNIGRYHADYLSRNRVRNARLAAVCDAFAPLEAWSGIRTFKDPARLFTSGEVDAVVIATPHYQHTTLGIAALEAGLHVMVEKPISAHKADAERLIGVSQAHAKQVFAGMFQLRVEPRYLRIRRLLDSGELGRILRVNWIITDWFRTDAYYASSAWRATWKGEGGGVLLNQCLHNLDVLGWLLGLPARLRGFCQLGRFHPIEVEDNVTAYLEYPDGATGVFVTSTGEAPGTNRFEIAGSRGRLVLENNRLTYTRNETDCLEFNRTSDSGFGRPEIWTADLPFTDADTPHAVLMQNFVDAIVDGTPLIAPGAEGMTSVELANAILCSSLRQQTIELPMDSSAYEKLLQQLIAESRHDKKVSVVAANDFTSSFRR